MSFYKTAVRPLLFRVNPERMHDMAIGLSKWAGRAAPLRSLMDKKRYHIIAAGGIFSAEDAYRKIRLGASAVQLLTALVYEGPGIVARINRGLRTLLQRDGFARVADAVGVDGGIC